MQKINYNIQIARGIAVLLVIFFHLGIEGFSAGFLGVDFFFGISGFLMARIIIKYNTSSKYLKSRFLRLYPALFGIVLLCLLLGLALQLPGELKASAYAGISALTTTSNYYYIFNTGYFDQAAELRPLLHTWSLSNEFLCYFLFAFIMFGQKDKPRIKLAAYVVGLSLILSFSISYYNHIYLEPFSRVYVFFASFILSSLLIGKQFSKNQGILLFSLSTFFFFALVYKVGQTDSEWPNIWVIFMPLIVAGICSTEIYRVKERYFSGIIFIGALSYVMYLVHWPVIVFYKIFTRNNNINSKEVLLLLVVIFIATLVFYWLFEKKRIIKSIKSIIVSTLLIMSFAIGLILLNGASWRVDKGYEKYSHKDKMINWDLCKQSLPLSKNLALCQTQKVIDTSKPSLVFIGDSHSKHFAAVVSSHSNDFNIYRIRVPAKQAKSNYNVIAKVLPDLLPNQDTTLAIAYRWSNLSDKELQAIQTGVNDISRTIKTSDNRKILLLRDIPAYTTDPAACLLSQHSQLMYRSCNVNFESNVALKYVANTENTKWSKIKNKKLVPINTHLWFCTNTYCSATFSDNMIMRDSNHLDEFPTNEFSKYIKNKLAEVINAN